MYLQKIRLENIKCFEDVEISFTQGRNKPPRLMTVILGDNGVGKTTLLQVMAIALGGLQVSRFPFSKGLDNWARLGNQRGSFHATIYPDKGDPDIPKRNLQVSFEVESIARDNQSKIGLLVGKDRSILQRTAYNTHDPSSKGWLACGYGPLRRVTNQRISSVEYAKINRFASLFGENEQLIPVEDWLIELDRRALIAERDGQDSNDRQLFNKLAQTLLQILPEENFQRIAPSNIIPLPSTYIRVTSEGVRWLDSFGNWITLSQLSDGYQSTMSWAGDLVSRLSQAFPQADNLLEQEAVVLLDEVDIHLHPTWQRTILNQLRQTFPKIQFVVTTHSPLVAASAKEGELFVLKRDEDHVAIEPVSSVQGWRADQILTSDLFGLDTTRDPETERYLARYDELLALRTGKKWDTNLAQELDQLENILRQKLPPPGETPAQRQLQQKMEDFINQTLELGSNK